MRTRSLFCVLSAPVGPLTLLADEEALVGVHFGNEKTAPLPSGSRRGEGLVLEAAARQLMEYFRRERRCFDLPLRMEGTDFRLRTWQALLTIPYGETRTYGQIAAQIGSPRAVRAVGGANHHNPLSIVVPCHRVVGADGGLVGFGGGLEVKRSLLELEGVRLGV